ncbi:MULTISPECIES: DUF2840 domain-containing protein [unclassified Nitrobacter]|uniref:DUF2840 domain-containing protein n=1 Tax=unclassified Nitrobacter TaxID=2620411 RepID=UPI00092B7286|nr:MULTISPECIES: DUF2840 domain-containing protein [unclassified Nitrobacter]MBN9147911.1 DUF2840 domain-containing protein [Nitrobacter sp.]MBN9489927.1 DUF2840 domain-containing protein [Alphaproteobacteria bacterium]OJV01407.1 MAG: glycosidase [Nitrobacter sp. 62-23]
MTTRSYTSVLAVFQRDRINIRLRFAKPVRERRLDRRRRLALFAPNSIFALLRWERGPYGTALSHLTIMRTVAPGETCLAWPYVHPGAETLLFASGWHKVERVLQTVDAVEALGVDPSDAAPDYWQHVHNRLRLRQPHHAYTVEQHRAWLRRRELLS